jgi:hypothetical protein
MNSYGLAPAQQAAPVANAGGGQLEIHLSFLFLQWIPFLVTPRIVINGYPQNRSWGKHVIDMPPGQYQLEAFFPYFFWSKCGLARQVIAIHPGCVTTVRYSAPFFLFMGGSMSVAPPRPMQGGYPQGYPQGPGMQQGGPQMQGQQGYQQLPPRNY